MDEKTLDVGKVELIVDDSNVAQSATIMEKFDRGLDELNRKMPDRRVSAIELDVTETIRPFLPASAKIGGVIDSFESLGLHPTRDKGASHIYFTYFSIPFGRLAAGGRSHFLPGDKLVISYTWGTRFRALK